MVAEFIEVALVADVGRKAARADSQAGLPAPGELFPAFGIAVEVGQFGTTVQEVMPDRTAVQADGAGSYTDQDRNIEVLILLRFDNLAGAGLADAEIGAVGVKNQFRLDEYRATNTRPGAKLRTELDVFDTKIKGVFTVAYRNVVRAGRQGLKTAFYAESELRPGGSGAAKEDGYQKQVFHTCSDFNVQKTEEEAGSYTHAENRAGFNHTLKGVLIKRKIGGAS